MSELLHLDVGCGGNKGEGWTGMDVRPLPGVDIVHDAEETPWPLEDGSCSVVNMSHLIEHIKPWRQIAVMDEAWRVLKEGGMLTMATPYGSSYGFLQDPTHCSPWVEATVMYFCPFDQSGTPSPLYRIYQPRPWRLEGLTTQQNGNMEVALRKVDGAASSGGCAGLSASVQDSVELGES